MWTTVFPCCGAQSQAGDFFQLQFWKQLEVGISAAAQEALYWLGAWSSFFFSGHSRASKHWKISPLSESGLSDYCAWDNHFKRYLRTAGDLSSSLICSRSTRSHCWKSLQVYTNETGEVSRSEKSHPKGSFSIGNSCLWFWDIRDPLMMSS